MQASLVEVVYSKLMQSNITFVTYETWPSTQNKSREQVQKELQKQKEEYARFEATRKEKRIATNRKSFVFEMLDVDGDGFINRKKGV